MEGIVIHQHKVVYWQVPKAACTAVKGHFCNVLGLNIDEKDIHSASNFEWTSVPVKDYFNFALVRNPFSRLYSLWCNKVTPEIDEFVFPKGGRVRQGMSFADFVRIVLKIPHNRANAHYALQSSLIPEGVQAIRIEECGGLLRGLLPLRNYTGAGEHWKGAYTPELIKPVYQYYKRDFIQFRYRAVPWSTILIDCDGVLTDGTLTITHDGEKLFKKFNTRDVRAIRELIFNGFHVVIVSADDWPGVFHFADKVGAEVLISKDKKENGFTDYIAIGDDAWDAPMLEKAALAFAPADADPSVFQCRKHVNKLQTPGGRGVMAEVVRVLIGEEHHES